MDGTADARHIPRMIHLDFTDDELQDAAQAARVASVQAEKDAERQSNPRIKAMFDGTARRFSELAAKFERARSARRTGS
jgi:chromosome segregation ATPase